MRIVIFALSIVLAAGLKSQTPSPQTLSIPVTPAAPTVAVDQDYVLRSGDAVSMTVFQEPDLACAERIAGDGTISVPLAGRVKVAGKTVLSAASAIKAALETNYLVNAQVTLAVNEASKEFFTLLGQVAAPGAYSLPATGRLSLMQAIGMAGGFTRLASPSRITVKRSVAGKEEVIEVDGKKLSSGKGTGGFDVFPGDVITVKERLF
jgi:polysaccharide export outer membrane protein